VVGRVYRAIHALVFGPISSIFDLLTFAVLWFGFGANSPVHQSLFQTGWFTVGLATQLLIVHVIRTEKVPLLQSRATTPVVIGTLLMLMIGLALPWVPLGQILGFVHLPATYSLWWSLSLQLISSPSRASNTSTADASEVGCKRIKEIFKSI
jgi:Mg2+-importing ATPase